MAISLKEYNPLASEFTITLRSKVGGPLLLLLFANCNVQPYFQHNNNNNNNNNNNKVLTISLQDVVDMKAG